MNKLARITLGVSLASLIAFEAGAYSSAQRGDDRAASLRSAASAYVKGLADSHRATAKAVPSGEIASLDAVADRLQGDRQQLSASLGAIAGPELERSAAEGDAITDRESAARTLEWLAEGFFPGTQSPPEPIPADVSTAEQLKRIADRLDQVAADVRKIAGGQE